MKPFLLFLFCQFAVSSYCSAEEEKQFAQITGDSARVLFQAIAKSLPRKSNRIEFKKIECAYKGPGAGDACHDCKDHVDANGKKCKLCAELIPSKPTYCKLNQKRFKAKTKTSQALARALDLIKTGSVNASGGWHSQVIRDGFCTSLRGHFYCSYDYVNP